MSAKPLIFSTQDATLTCEQDTFCIEGPGAPNTANFHLGDMTHEQARELIRYIAKCTYLPDPYPSQE